MADDMVARADRGRQEYETYGWSGCDGASWDRLDVAHQQAWEHAARLRDEVVRLRELAQTNFDLYAEAKSELRDVQAQFDTGKVESSILRAQVAQQMEAIERVTALADRLVSSVDWEGNEAVVDRAFGSMILAALVGDEQEGE